MTSRQTTTKTSTTKTWKVTCTARMNQSWTGTVEAATRKEAGQTARKEAQKTERWGSCRWTVWTCERA